MALASNTPTQIDSTRSPSRSFRITIGRFVTGSTISPLMFISINMTHALSAGTLEHVPAQTVRPRPGHPHGHQAAEPRLSAFGIRIGGSTEIHYRVPVGPSGQPAVAAPADRIHQHVTALPTSASFSRS